MKKSLFAFLGALLAFSRPLCAQALPPNPYDTLSRVLTPIATVFSPEAKLRALSATLVLEEMTDLPRELKGSRLELLLQPPDRALLRGRYNGQMVTICRAGESVWITPNTPPFDLLGNGPGDGSRKKKKSKKQNGGLGPMELPFPPQQLVLLPLLFQVKDVADEQGMRTLGVKLMPELARGLEAEEWSARLSLNAAGQPARLQILGPGWSLVVRVERLDYAVELPAATWQAPLDALRLESGQVQRWINEIGRQVDAHRPARGE